MKYGGWFPMLMDILLFSLISSISVLCKYFFTFRTVFPDKIIHCKHLGLDFHVMKNILGLGSVFSYALVLHNRQ